MRVSRSPVAPLLFGLFIFMGGTQAFAQCQISVYTPNQTWHVESGISFPIPVVRDRIVVCSHRRNFTLERRRLRPRHHVVDRKRWPLRLVGSGTPRRWRLLDPDLETGGGLIAISNSDLFEFVQYMPFCRYAVTSPMCSNWIAGDTETISGKASDMPVETPSTSTSAAME